jgi:DNA-binding transcriptional LysR family regulator
MEHLETRELRYFVAVAEELHFGRAAQRLGIAQPPLSRAIRQLERRVGVTLLSRESRGVTLTPAGEVLLREGRRALDAVAAAARRAQRAGQNEPRLVVVTKAGGDAGLLPDILALYESQPGAVRVDVHICGIGEQARLLRDGQADLALVHRPYDDISGFDTEELLVQQHVAILPRQHRLAGRSALVLADLDGEPMPRWPGVDEPADAPLVHDAAQLLQLIALGRAVAVLPESTRTHLRDDLVAVPVLDASPSTLLLAWPAGVRSRAVAGFVRAATTAAAHSMV